MPGYGKDELRGYLECGILCFGFARARCTGCGQGFVVAFSRKSRGVCPSCNGGHMAQTAACLADHVSPPAPVWPWVISSPKRLRGFLADRRIANVRYVLPRHKAVNWVGRRSGRKSTRPGADGVVQLTPLDFLDRLADLVPPPLKHRHRYRGVFAPNHKLRGAVTALASGNVGKRLGVAAGGHDGTAHAAEGCCDAS